MGLLLNIEYKGFSFEAYCRITSYRVQWNNKVYVEASYFKDRTNPQIIYGEDFVFEHDKVLPFSLNEGYIQMKNLSKFQDAIDVFESSVEEKIEELKETLGGTI